MTPQIFVSIASYRDPELADTIRDMIQQAEFPERLHICVLTQCLPEDESCHAPDLPQVYEQVIDAHSSRGVCWARHEIQKNLPVHCDYYLQIDSHMRFVNHWDTRMIDMLADCDSELSVLSCYPVGYRPPNRRKPPVITSLKPKAFNHQGVLSLDSLVTPYAHRPEKPISMAFLAAGFLFAPAQAFRDLRYDPYLYFIGEEMMLSVRLWTRGWDFYAPNDVLIYHNYHPVERPRHWEDNQHWQHLNTLSVERIHYLLTGERPTHSEALVDIDNYSMGEVRSLSDYERFAGVDFQARRIENRAASDRFQD